MMTDPIADMLTRIRNAIRAQKPAVTIPSSRIKRSIAEILKEEGYITSFSVEKEGAKEHLALSLKYQPDGDCVIHDLQRVSTPGCRVYSANDEIPKVLGGLGVCIVSTSRGVMTDRRCREERVGGELLCNVW
jgi:small subunit ribosomal protein S8